MGLRGQNMGGSEAGIWGGAQRPEYGGSEAKIRGLRGQNKGGSKAGMIRGSEASMKID
jgi:hypothetical protein